MKKPDNKTEIDQYLRTDHLRADIKGRSVRGAAVTMTAQGCKFVLGMASTVVLARLLTPQDFGLVAMVVAVTGLFAMFKDMGLSMATVQREDLTHEQVSTLFWINLLLGIVIMLITAGIAPAISWFYGEQRLTSITLVSAFGLLFGGLAVQHQALLRRQMRFGSLAAIDIISMLSGIAAAIFFAWAGAGYWALVLMPLFSGFTNALMVWIACGWRPGLPVRQSGVRSMLAFGSNLTGANFLNYSCRNLDNILIGSMLGARPLGMYSKAYRMLLMPIQQINYPISAVVVPTLSRLQAEPEFYRRYYCRAISIMVSFGMPVVVFAFVNADKLVLAFLGDQWGEAVLIFQALAPAAFIGTFNVAAGWVFVPLGRTDRQFRCVFVSSIFVIGAFFIGVRWGAMGVAVAFSAITCILRLPQIIYAYRGTSMRLRDFGSALWRPSLASLSAGVVLRGVSALDLSLGSLIADLVLYGALFGMLYIIAWFVVPGGLEFLKDLYRMLMEIWKQPRVNN